MSPKTIIFIGRSGCGKGTQADLLRKYIDEQDKEKRLIFNLETGAGFREFIKKDNYASKLAKEIMATGGLLPEFLAVWVWSNILIENLTDQEHLIIDGTPRSLAEAMVLDNAIKFFKRVDPVVLHLDVSREWAETHLQRRGRADDVNIEYIRKRQDWYDHDVILALKYLKKDPFYRYVEINGEQTIEKVQYDIVENVFGDSQ